MTWQTTVGIHAVRAAGNTCLRVRYEQPLGESPAARHVRAVVAAFLAYADKKGRERDEKSAFSVINQEEVSAMAKCAVCGKGMVFGNAVSHSHRKTNRTWKPNIRKVRVIDNGTVRTVSICARCLRTMKKQQDA